MSQLKGQSLLPKYIWLAPTRQVFFWKGIEVKGLNNNFVLLLCFLQLLMMTLVLKNKPHIIENNNFNNIQRKKVFPQSTILVIDRLNLKYEENNSRPSFALRKKLFKLNKIYMYIC